MTKNGLYFTNENLLHCFDEKTFILPFDCFLGLNDVPWYNDAKEGNAAFGLWKNNTKGKRMPIYKKREYSIKDIEEFFGKTFNLVCFIVQTRLPGEKDNDVHIYFFKDPINFLKN